jgi:hypothetical protein
MVKKTTCFCLQQVSYQPAVPRQSQIQKEARQTPIINLTGTFRGKFKFGKFVILKVGGNEKRGGSGRRQ